MCLIHISPIIKLCVDIDLPKPAVSKVTFSYCPINKINFTDFNQDISNAFPILTILTSTRLLTTSILTCH